jgi:membrane associated rhomboid family serine protease
VRSLIERGEEYLGVLPAFISRTCSQSVIWFAAEAAMLIFLRSLVALIVIFLIAAALIGAADTIPHREFSGPIIGAAGAVFAAGLAWEAVQRQIAATYDVAGMPARQVTTAIKEEITPLIKALNVLWTILDDFIVFEGTKNERLSRSTWIG